MLYYKIPIVEGRVDCSAGSILCCAYPQGNYMVCKFESVATVGSKWVEITADEFEANCPSWSSGIDTAPVESPEKMYLRIREGLLEWSSDGVTWTAVSGEGGTYVLPIASTDTLGGIKVGTGLTIDEKGVLSAVGGGDLPDGDEVSY